ncbi:adenosylmethionine--8-amino-7-oxononanoate transaminase [Salinimicrobium terrae]|uniref:adenosylmethionine--8-amino-7-oxononanoate transaminase n=1 Tax=Salinimicrobium terrae TaxID=470866 RepID=UPI00041887D2|nr:adenosylmethionine--8-amino-7-oxononanoate transaminase [Salinimicrobium terrae]
MKIENLSQRDKKHLWHPLTQHKLSGDMLAIVKAKGAVLYDEQGKEYVDGISSWYTAVYGHCNEDITNKVAAQMQQLDQVVFSGFTHEPAIALSEALIKILPANQEKLFFSDNGSTATEVGIKMALQYHHNHGRKRKVMLAFEEGFHGDTFGAMSVSELSVYNGAFEEHFIKVLRLPVPVGENNAEVLNLFKKFISEENLAGFIYEPLIQGAAGMKFVDPEGLDQILKICKENKILTIADEVMTGFGKTGKNFASDYLQNKPDIICMSKALTAGLLPMAVTSCTAEVFNAFYSDELSKGLFHGHTYTANPLACTAALAGIELLTSKQMQENIKRVIDSHKAFKKRIQGHPKVKNTRHLGTIIAFELDVKMERYGSLRNRLFEHFMSQGIFLRPLGNTIYIAAPYITTNEQLEKIYLSIEAALDKF